MGDLGETWSEVTGAAGAEAAARSYEQMVKTWIMVDLGETWGEVAQAAGAAEAAARSYERAKDDLALSEKERLQVRDQYKQAARGLDEALRAAKVREQDGLWSEVMDAAQRAQTAGHAFLSAKHDPDRPESERREAKKVYAQAKSRVASLMVELKIMQAPEVAVSEVEAKESDFSVTAEEGAEAKGSSVEEPALVASEENPEADQHLEPEEEASEPAPEGEAHQEEPENPPSWDAGQN